jgi:hypothetical protein
MQIILKYFLNFLYLSHSLSLCIILYNFKNKFFFKDYLTNIENNILCSSICIIIIGLILIVIAYFLLKYLSSCSVKINIPITINNTKIAEPIYTNLYRLFFDINK